MEAEGRDGSLPAATAAEEAMKRNTDCVYFLASPLTCKKGVECEYRHSEGARMNPRDCWYWLNGNCSNPKCAFRHPPLDGILGTPGIGIPSQAPALRMPLPYPPASHNSNKQGIPCYYFQMGACMKGDMCSFMHGPPELKKTNHVTQQTPRVGVHDSISPHLVTPSCLGKVEQQNIPTVKSERPVEVVPFSHESVCKAERFQGNGFAIKSDARVDTDNFTKSNASSIPGSIGNTLSRVRSHHSEDTDEGLIDDGEADEFLHESSPGFDVLVDDDTEDPTYFLGEEEFQDGSCYENNMNAASDFGRYKASDSDAATRYERGQYHEIAEYGQYMHAHDHYGQEFHEASTEGVIGRPSMSNRRSRRAEPPTEINGSDLRYQLLKKRKLRGLRSISPGRKDAYRRDDRYARGNDGHVHGPGLHREKGHIYRQGTVSKRLEGRISVANHGDLYCNRDFDRERSWGNSFSRKPTDGWGRFENRINWGKHREDVSEERKHAARSTRKDGDGLEFDGPKSFSELRGAKISGRQRQRSNGDSDCAFHSTLEKNTRSDKQLLDLENESCSFEGPKPLSMILKRKREATLQGCTSADCDAKVLQDSDFMVSHPTNGEEQRPAQSSLQSETLEMEDPDFENYAEEGEAEHEYEEDDGGEFAPKNDEVEEYDNTYQDDEEYVDGEDGDEFAQKLGVMYS